MSNIKLRLEQRDGLWIAATDWDASFSQPVYTRVVLHTGVSAQDYPSLDTAVLAFWAGDAANEYVDLHFGDYRYQALAIKRKEVESKPIPRPRKRRDGRQWVWRYPRWVAG